MLQSKLRAQIRKSKCRKTKQGQESIIGALAHCKKGVKLERASETSHFCPTISSFSTYHKTIICSLKEQLSCPKVQKQEQHSTIRGFWICDIARNINKTCAGWQCMHQRFKIYFAWSPRLKGVEFPFPCLAA